MSASDIEVQRQALTQEIGRLSDDMAALARALGEHVAQQSKLTELHVEAAVKKLMAQRNAAAPVHPGGAA